MSEVKTEAEAYIKKKFSDHDHDPLHARAVSMFLQGVEWAEKKNEEALNELDSSDLEYWADQKRQEEQCRKST